MKGKELLDTLKRYFAEQKGTGTISDSALANEIGQTQANITQWKLREQDITPRQIVNLLKSYRDAVETRLAETCISPVVEFFPITPVPSKRGTKYEVFSPLSGDKSDHPYRSGIRQALCDTQGIYLFYDSRGRALYAGQTNKQSLWNEINGAFNRERGRDLQSIKIVSHPDTKKKYERYDERTRQISERGFLLREVARYFSAYEVHSLMISNLESLIIRSFANDLLNKKMENFASKS